MVKGENIELFIFFNLSRVMHRRRPNKSRDRRDERRNSYAQSQLSGGKSPSSSSLNRYNRRANKYSESERHREPPDSEIMEDDDQGGNNWGSANGGYSPYESEMNQLQPRQRQRAQMEEDVEFGNQGPSSMQKG